MDRQVPKCPEIALFRLFFGLRLLKLVSAGDCLCFVEEVAIFTCESAADQLALVLVQLVVLDELGGWNLD